MATKKNTKNVVKRQKKQRIKRFLHLLNVIIVCCYGILLRVLAVLLLSVCEQRCFINFFY